VSTAERRPAGHGQTAAGQRPGPDTGSQPRALTLTLGEKAVPRTEKSPSVAYAGSASRDTVGELPRG